MGKDVLWERTAVSYALRAVLFDWLLVLHAQFRALLRRSRNRRFSIPIQRVSVLANMVLVWNLNETLTGI